MPSYSAPYTDPRNSSRPLMLGALGALLAVTVAAAAVGSVASISATEFYQALNRPSWAPPASVFGPVWSVLFLLMAIAAWIVVRVDGWERAKPAVTVYGIQLVANALWSWCFFRWHSGLAAFADVIVLLALVALTVVMFARTHKLAGALLLPYLAWVSFATALTWSVWQANPGTL